MEEIFYYLIVFVVGAAIGACATYETMKSGMADRIFYDSSNLPRVLFTVVHADKLSVSLRENTPERTNFVVSRVVFVADSIRPGDVVKHATDKELEDLGPIPYEAGTCPLIKDQFHAIG